MPDVKPWPNLTLWSLLAGLFLAGLFLAALPASGQEAVPPLPDRKPAPGGIPVTEAMEEQPDLPDPEDLPTLPWQSPKVNAALAACAEMLDGMAIDYEQLPSIRKGACGAPAPILVKSIGRDPAVIVEPPATVTCPLAAALELWLRDTVQPAALALGSHVTEVRNASSYKCRRRYGGANTKISEHALANALDISEFVLASGERVSVHDHWHRPPRPDAPPPPEPKPVNDNGATGSTLAVPVTEAKAVAATLPVPPPIATPPGLAAQKSAFLHNIHAAGCKTFETVLGPKANAAHKDHFHFDMKKRRYVKICD